MPDPVDTAYQRALAAARQRSFQLTRQGVDRTYRALAEVLNRLAADEDAGIINAARAEAIRQEVTALLRGFQRELIRVGEDAIGRTLIDVVEIHRQATAGLFQRYGPAGLESVAILQSFDRLPARALAAMVSRPNASTFRTLVNRRTANVVSEIDTFLDAAVARGVSAGRATQDLAALMARDDPKLLRLLDRAPGRSTLQAGTGEAYRGLDDADTKALRGLLYDSRRIVVTEANTASRLANDAAAAESPVVLATQFQLSGRHYVEDICDLLATQDAFGFGPGFYPAGHFPDSPHPFCGCLPGRAKFRPPSDWGTPKPPAPPLQINPSEPQHTERFAAKWTDRERERYQSQLVAALREADQRERWAA